MNNSEINLAIAKIEYPDRDWLLHKDGSIAHGYDYCNMWSDIGPIIEREKIAVSYSAKYKCWYAQDLYYEDLPDLDNTCNGAYSDTPTKAAALCYLKIKGVE